MKLPNNPQVEQILKSGLVPDRMFPFPEKVLKHPTIMAYANDFSHRYIMCTSGRQSFKTEVAKRKLMRLALTKPKKRYGIGMPVWGQVKSIYWTGALNILDLFPEILIKEKSDSELWIRLFNDTVIQLFSCDSVKRAEGSYFHGVLLDEAGDIDLDQVWQRSISPMLQPTQGFAWFVGVPRQDMGVSYKTMWKNHNKGQDPEWACYTWPSWDVLNEQEIYRLKADFDPRTFAVEFGGEFSDVVSGLCYYRFNESLHVKEVQYTEELPISICWDFNSGIMAPQFCQVNRDGFVRVFDEVVDRNTHVFQISPLVKQKLIQYAGGDESMAKSRPVHMYGDYAGTQHTANARGSAWEELKQLFEGWNLEIRIKPSPRIDRRISDMNARLQDANDTVHMVVDPKCKELIKDFQYISREDLEIRKDSLGERSHHSDAVGYFVYYIKSEFGI